MKKPENLKMNRRILAFLSALVFLNAHTAFATMGEAMDDYFKTLGPKLKRGFTEIVTSPAEIGCGIKNGIEDHPRFGAFTGFSKGIVFMGRRLLVGVAEVITFFLPEDSPLPPLCEAS